MNSFCRFFVYRPVCNHNAAKGRNRIGSQGCFPSFFHCRTTRHTTCVVMFENGQGRLVKIGYQRNSCINIEKVVIRYFFAMKLFKNLVKVPVEHALLVWILSVTELFTAVQSLTKSCPLIPVKIIKNRSIVSRRDFKSFLCKPAAIIQCCQTLLFFYQI